MLASFLKENHLLAAGAKVRAYRSRQSALQTCFTVNPEKTFAFCHDVDNLMKTMKINYKAEEWRLFIDSSKRSLKALLLDKDNKKPAVPIAYSTETKETYEKMQEILQFVDYEQHKWRICCDLKVVAMLCGMQGGYTKNMCFLCNWNTRYKGNQYQTHTWTDRGVNVIGEQNEKNIFLSTDVEESSHLTLCWQRFAGGIEIYLKILNMMKHNDQMKPWTWKAHKTQQN